MERNYEQEIVYTFGTRLRGIFELDERALPREIAALLDRLRKREECVTKSPEPRVRTAQLR